MPGQLSPSDSVATKAAKPSRTKPKRTEATDPKSQKTRTSDSTEPEAESKWSRSRFTRHLKRLWYVALIVSLFLHICGIGGLASIWVSHAMRDDSSTLDTQWETANEEQLETLAEVEPTETEELSQLEQSMSVSIPLAESLQASEVPQSMLTADVPSETPLQEMESADLLADISAEISGGSRGRTGGGGKFFGVDVQGKKFVYVIDCSGSMRVKDKGRERTRMQEVKLRMIESITNLSPESEFFIVFFRGKAFPMHSPTTVPARPSTRDRHLRWAAQVPVLEGGSTDPTAALELAFRLNPDVVYLLTDGVISLKDKNKQKKARHNLLALKQNRVHIHTILIGDGSTMQKKMSPKEFKSVTKDMKTIAENNGGSFTYIP